MLDDTSSCLFSFPQEERLAEEERIRKEKERDYLAPFLARIGDPPELQRKQMEEVAEVRERMHTACPVSLVLSSVLRTA